MLLTPSNLHRGEGDDQGRLQIVSLLANTPFSASVVAGTDALYGVCLVCFVSRFALQLHTSFDVSRLAYVVLLYYDLFLFVLKSYELCMCDVWWYFRI
jgi:hypothetical protein